MHRLPDYGRKQGPVRPIEVEQKVDQLKLKTKMERVFTHMCAGSDRFVQPWHVIPRDLGDMDWDSAKKCVADYLDRASKRP